MQKNLHCYTAEFLGTTVLIFAGCGSMVSNELHGGTLGHVGVALSWGLVVMCMIYAIGGNSGAHINPAVTIAFAISKRFAWKHVPNYIIAQLLGAIVGAILVRLLIGPSETLGATLPNRANGVHWLQAAGMEVALSWLLMFVIMGVSTGAKEVGHLAGVAVGGAVALCALFGGPISMASMNPARSLGPALVSGHTEYLWAYILAAIIGCALAVPSYRILCHTEGDRCCGPEGC